MLYLMTDKTSKKVLGINKSNILTRERMSNEEMKEEGNQLDPSAEIRSRLLTAKDATCCGPPFLMVGQHPQNSHRSQTHRVLGISLPL